MSSPLYGSAVQPGVTGSSAQVPGGQIKIVSRTLCHLKSEIFSSAPLYSLRLLSSMVYRTGQPPPTPFLNLNLIMHMCVGLCSCVHMPPEATGIGCPHARQAQVVIAAQRGFCKLSLVSLQEQYVLLVPKPSISPASQRHYSLDGRWQMMAVVDSSF